MPKTLALCIPVMMLTGYFDLAQAATVYGIDTYAPNAHFFKFDTTTPANWTIISPVSIDLVLMKFNSAGTVLYGTDGGDHIGTISTNTGVFTQGAFISNLSAHQPEGLAVDRTSGSIYLTGSDLNGNSELFTLNPVSGVATLVGSGAGHTAMESLAASASGDLYSVSVFDDSLYKWNKVTGTATRIGPLAAFVFSPSLDFDLSSDSLYGYLDLTPGSFVSTFCSINVSTGLATPLFTPPGRTDIQIAIQPNSVSEPSALICCGMDWRPFRSSDAGKEASVLSLK